MPYPEAMVAPMREELVEVGFSELTSADEVEQWMADASGSALLVINSVCGCAAGNARPAVRIAVQHTAKPTRLATVFAGQDVDAVAKARGFFADVPPSSPSMALFKDGALVHFIPRHMIEGRDANAIAFELVEAFDKYCA